MGEGVDDCRTKGIDFLVPMVVKGAIGNEDNTLVVAFCLAAVSGRSFLPRCPLPCGNSFGRCRNQP